MEKADRGSRLQVEGLLEVVGVEEDRCVELKNLQEHFDCCSVVSLIWPFASPCGKRNFLAKV